MQESRMVEQELHKKHETEFRKQLEHFKSFKRDMEKAGVYTEEKYEVPLMHRIFG